VFHLQIMSKEFIDRLYSNDSQFFSILSNNQGRIQGSFCATQKRKDYFL